jgi:asparagine synthase (glutamine-hydrolysing)
MCGIVGHISENSNITNKWIARARDTMTHRGPDGEGLWCSKDLRVALGHRRLSVIDLSPLGNQPMRDEKNKLVIVYNGEIYNKIELGHELMAKGYVFRSQSDTEVLLASYAHWGEECLSHLNGMFAFAIFDEKKNSLFIARDRAGEKPLFYNFDEKTGAFSFASELKAILENPEIERKINAKALDCYLTFGFVPAEHCILNGCKKLPPAHALSFNLNLKKVTVWRYWSPNKPLSSEINKNEHTLLGELEVLLADSVSRQMVADVPVGVLLSGGVDSSLITALAARSSSKVKTFTIGFPGHGAYDETEHARLIANHFGTTHTELMAEPSSAELFPQLAVQFDEPMADSSMIPTWLVSKLLRDHCTVALGGDGGDELFGGYPHYSRLMRLQEYTKYIPRLVRSMAAQGAETLLPIGFANSNIRSWIMATDVDFGKQLPIYTGLFDRSTRKRLMKAFPDFTFCAEDIYATSIPDHSGLLTRATLMDFQNYLPEDLLVKIDRASMMNSLEIRAPMLDYRLIEFAFGEVPEAMKATTTETKILLKKLATKLLPAGFDTNRKQGFSVPLSSWLQEGPFHDLFWDVLTSQDSIFDKKTVVDLLNGLKRGQKNDERLYSLVQFELWRKHYGMYL